MWPFQRKAVFDLTDSMPISCVDDVLRLAEDRLKEHIDRATDARRAAKIALVAADDECRMLTRLIAETKAKRKVTAP